MGKLIVTGGAGFIGSNLCKALAASHEVTAIDSLVSGRAANLPPEVSLKEENIPDPSLDFSGADAVFHLAADPDVRSSAVEPAKSFRANVEGTFNVLEACRKADVSSFVFASTSTVYGAAELLPTPESAPICPISNYGASKAAGEAYVFSYAETYGIKSVILRYANIYGAPSTHGVMHDFCRKLQNNPNKLEILGDGKQSKSYLHVSDAVAATVLAWEKSTGKAEAFNVGSSEFRTVDEVAFAVSGVLAVSPALEHTGGSRGWPGDVRKMLLDTSKLNTLGWREQVPFEEGVKKYISWILDSS